MNIATHRNLNLSFRKKVHRRIHSTLSSESLAEGLINQITKLLTVQLTD